jgi:hypothetical protein
VKVSSKSKPKPKLPGNEEDDEMNGDSEEDHDESESWSAESYFTNTNYQAKKTVFLLFINRRSSSSRTITSMVTCC